MKRAFFILALTALSVFVFAQPPQKMSYQCVVRNTGGALITNQSVRIRISILQGTSSGTVIYTETQTPSTNANGLLTIEIGGGTGFDVINWANGPYFLKTETDPEGGTNYTISGTSQLLSVPYALFSSTAQTADYNNLTNRPNLSNYLTTESDPLFAVSPAHEITSGNITNWNTAYNWGNHSGLYRPISYVPAWSEITGKPTTIAGFGINDAMTTAHVANGISSTNITNWNNAYGWGNHAGLYRPVNWVPSWSDLTEKPNFAAVATSGSYNDLSNKPTLSVSTDATLSGNGTTVSPLKIAQQAASPGQALKWDGTTWAPGPDLTETGIWAQNGTNIYYNAGAVGIGTNTPYGFLDIYGNTNSGFAHLCLTENEADFARLMFKNIITASKSWSIAGGTSATDANSILNFYYDNGSTGNNYLSIAGNGNINIPGKVGIGTTSPAALLHTEGNGTGQGNVLFVGQYKETNPGNPPVAGAGTRMMWYPDKAAFRAGKVDENQWDAANIGNYSAAMGYGCKASGICAIATGFYTTASNYMSTAMGYRTTASGQYSTVIGSDANATGYGGIAIGYAATASGMYSTAMGVNTVASGDLSTAMGAYTTASSYYSTAVGRWNIGGGNKIEWIDTDPLFEIGNGGGYPVQTHNAMTVLKNGYVGFGTASPATYLNILGNSNTQLPQLLLSESEGDYARLSFKNTAATTKNWSIAGRPDASDENSLLNFWYWNGSSGTDIMSIRGNGNVGIGTTAPSYKLTVNGTAWCSSGSWTGSDIRWKKNIEDLSSSLSGILVLNPVSYDLKTDELPEMGFETGKQIGLIAQEVEKVFPELVRTDDNGYKAVSYEKLSVILLKGIKEQQQKIEKQQRDIDELKNLVRELLNSYPGTGSN